MSDQEPYDWDPLIAIVVIVSAAMFAFAVSGCGKPVQVLEDFASIECYSGAQLIYKGTSTGTVINLPNSDVYQFRDADTGRLMKVSGNCIVTYGN